MTLSINGTKHNWTHSMTMHFAEYRYAECQILFTVMLSVSMLNVVMLSVVAPNLYISFVTLSDTSSDNLSFYTIIF